MNMTVKRTAALLAILALLAALFVGCGKDKPDPSATAPTTTTQTTLPPTTTTTVNGVMEGELTVREGPGREYAAIGGVLMDESVVIVGREGDWFKIRFGDTYGYINAHYVAVDGQPNASQMNQNRPQATTTTAFKAVEGVVSGDTIKVYAAPDASDDAMSEIKKDTVVTITGKDGEWLQIEFNGGIGYVKNEDVTEATTTTVSTGKGKVTTTTGKNGIPNTNADDVLG